MVERNIGSLELTVDQMVRQLMANNHVQCGCADRYSGEHNLLRIPPYMYLGFRLAYSKKLAQSF